MLVLLLYLGTWQVLRYGWKTDLIEKLQTRSESAAIALPKNSVALEKFEFQHVLVSGTFLHEHEFYLFGRSLHGSPGLHVITPFQRTDGAGYVLVDRGWVPFDKRDPAERAEGQVEDLVEIDGMIRLAKGPGTFTPDNDAKGNYWYFIEPDAMAKVAGLDALPDYYVLSGIKDTPGGFPVARQWRVDIRNHHIEYAITWYLMAVALIVIYVVYHRQRR